MVLPISADMSQRRICRKNRSKVRNGLKLCFVLGNVIFRADNDFNGISERFPVDTRLIWLKRPKTRDFRAFLRQSGQILSPKWSKMAQNGQNGPFWAQKWLFFVKKCQKN